MGGGPASAPVVDDQCRDGDVCLTEHWEVSAPAICVDPRLFGISGGSNPGTRSSAFSSAPMEGPSASPVIVVTAGGPDAPTYTLKVYAEGCVGFDRLANVFGPGRHWRQAPPDDVSTLAQRVCASGLGFPSPRAGPDRPAATLSVPGRRATDQPGVRDAGRGLRLGEGTAGARRRARHALREASRKAGATRLGWPMTAADSSDVRVAAQDAIATSMTRSAS